MPNLNTPHNRPITLALLAMGGEGGGVLADWAIDMAEHNGFFAQTTSVPGVAQRTGTTVYYLEFFPDDGAGKPGVHEPVLSTMATPGDGSNARRPSGDASATASIAPKAMWAT